MSVILHMADLHMSAQDSSYAFSVFDEILETAVRCRADFLVLAGDTFDSYPDAYNLRSEFRKRLKVLDGQTEVLLLPGNHEYLQGSRERLESLDLGKITLLSSEPFTLLEREKLEFLTIPHQADYSRYRDWKIEAKRGTRIAIAHAEITGMSFSGLPGSAEEEGGAVMDPDLFDCMEIDYAALGHIHARRSQAYNKVQLHYPGSARVWRKGETGAHGILLVTTGEKLSAEFLPLAAAGEYRLCKLPVSFDGIPEFGEETAAGWGKQDWIEIELSGIVENEKTLAAMIDKWEAACRSRVRRLSIDRTGVSVFAGIASHPLARQFISHWKSREPEAGDTCAREVWLEAREIGLAEIRALLEARK